MSQTRYPDSYRYYIRSQPPSSTTTTTQSQSQPPDPHRYTTPPNYGPTFHHISYRETHPNDNNAGERVRRYTYQHAGSGREVRRYESDYEPEGYHHHDDEYEYDDGGDGHGGEVLYHRNRNSGSRGRERRGGEGLTRTRSWRDVFRFW
ncbi:hypothetical protein CFE70_010509 [Pyrenophora teres f. teres 0-1]